MHIITVTGKNKAQFPFLNQMFYWAVLAFYWQYKTSDYLEKALACEYRYQLLSLQRFDKIYKNILSGSFFLLTLFSISKTKI